MLRRSAAALVATTILLAGGTGVNAALATTGPDPYVVVNVTLLDGRIMLSKLRVSHVTFVDFRVSNAGKLSHNFRIGGHTTPALKPGQTTHLLVAFPEYGTYLFRCTVHATPKMRGRFEVDRPVLPG